MRAWSVFLVAHRRLTTTLDAELRSAVDMTLDEYDVLHQLARGGSAMRMSDLAGEVLISRPTTTRVVDRLVTRGWVTRERDGGDRRVVRVELTTDGRTALRAAAKVHLDGIARWFESPLDPQQLEQLGAALEQVVDADS